MKRPLLPVTALLLVVVLAACRLFAPDRSVGDAPAGRISNARIEETTATAGVVETASGSPTNTSLAVDPTRNVPTLEATPTVGRQLQLLVNRDDPRPTPPLPDASRAVSWEFVSTGDADAPALLQQGADGYALASDWEVLEIGYLYQWWGLGDPVMDWREVTRVEGAYSLEGRKIDNALIGGLLSAVARLRPTSVALSAQTHFDDYSSWSVDITGRDGQHLTLFSTSNGDENAAPWNVLYNGQLYAQLDGAIGAALWPIFASERGQPAAAFFPGGGDPDRRAFASQGWPLQLWLGYEGLLPLSDGLTYQLDRDRRVLTGLIEGRSSIAGLGHMVIGTITDLARIALKEPNGSQVTCDIDDVEGVTDEAAAVWSFTCAVIAQPEGTRAGYLLEVSFETDSGEAFVTDGVLWVTWSDSEPAQVMPLPDHFLAPLYANPAVADLLTDHVLYFPTYAGSVDRDNLDDVRLAGDVILFGQSTVTGFPVRYTIGTPFSITEGTVEQWALDRTAVDDMLADIIQLALVRRALAADPGLMINMWYAQQAAPLEQLGLIDDYRTAYAVELAACGSLPSIKLPDDTEPLRAFGLNQDVAFWQPDFVLLDGQPVVAQLDLFPVRDDRNGVTAVLMPEIFDTGEHPPFERIWLDNGGGFFSDASLPVLTLWVPDEADGGSENVYQAIAAELPVAVDREFASLWKADGVTFLVTTDGNLEVATCAEE